MNLDKSKKRIAKRAKMGFHGYPQISIQYFGQNESLASEVVVTFIDDEGAEPMAQSFKSEDDARESEVIQSAIVKMIERSEAKTVISSLAVNVIE